MNRVLDLMLKIYKPKKDLDWMGYKMTKNNPYTFHHIVEKRDGGRAEIKNGAILTEQAHQYLNYLDLYCPEAYDKFQEIFRFINDFNGPIPRDWWNDIYVDIYELLYEIQVLKKYPFLKKARKIMTPKQRRRIEYENRKKTKMKYKERYD